MSVYLNPSSSLGFNRPLTVLVKRTLTISNNNEQPVAFKVKTTAPKLYCVRPNSGRVEPGQTAEVSVMLQPLKDEPPLNAKCKDKFLIQSTLITPEKEQKPLAEIWSSEGGSEADTVHQQKLKVVYLPPEGQTLVEEDENAAGQSSIMDDQYDTVRQPPSINGHNPIPEFNRSSMLPDHAGQSHHEDFSAAQEEHNDEHVHPTPPVLVTVQPPESRPPPVEAPQSIHVEPAPVSRTITEPIHVPPPAPVIPPAPAQQTIQDHNAEQIRHDLQEARAEIERLRSLLAAAAPPSEVRRRTRRLSDATTIVPGSDVGTIDEPLSQEGVPLQVVVAISLLVFVTTYLFF